MQCNWYISNKMVCKRTKPNHSTKQHIDSQFQKKSVLNELHAITAHKAESGRCVKFCLITQQDTAVTTQIVAGATIGSTDGDGISISKEVGVESFDGESIVDREGITVGTSGCWSSSGCCRAWCRGSEYRSHHKYSHEAVDV